jgi:hypothetical protein
MLDMAKRNDKRPRRSRAALRAQLILVILVATCPIVCVLAMQIWPWFILVYMPLIILAVYFVGLVRCPHCGECYFKQNDYLNIFTLEPVAELRAEKPMADDRASQEHQRLMGGRIFLLSSFQFSKLVQPGQAPFDEPAGFAQAAAMGTTTFGQQRLYPLFLSRWRCGSES